MHKEKSTIPLLNQTPISWFDFIIMGLLLIAGFFYLHDSVYWGLGNISGVPYGDSQFWWDGAVQIAQGILQDNPGKGFRPGYFILTGLTLPVLGQQFKQFFPYFLLAFLTGSTIFYFALRPLVGRWTAACVVGMLIFNSFTAEWVATPTTDATGLLLNLVALSCLLIGINRNLHRGWLSLFALFFALATLTRPLMTPFIGLVFLTILLVPTIGIKKKVITALIMLIVFSVPTFSWMGIQKILVNEWSVSTGDASTFYGASDPAIQAWHPSMYEKISKLTEARYHIKPTEALLNQTFWHETLNNYQKYAKYHFNRIIPHVWEIASFTPKRSAHGSEQWRITFLILVALGMAFWLLLQRHFSKAIILSVIAFSIFNIYPEKIITIMTLGGAFLALLVKPQKKSSIAIFLVSCYWFVGVATLYLIGGTWGPPLGAIFDLNALGYRLGSQFFFVGDLLAAYFLYWIAIIPEKNESNFYYRPSPLARIFVMSFFGIFFISTLIVYIIGTVVVVERNYARSVALPTPFPSVISLVTQYHQKIGHRLTPAVSMNGSLNKKMLSSIDGKKDSGDIIFTGIVSPFIWNLEGQKRAQILVHTQSNSYPPAMGPSFLILEIPQHIDVKDWQGVQGAFVVRQIKNNHNESHVPYYYTTPTLRAFIPLSRTGMNYDFAKTIWFPLVKNATQLESSHELQFENSKITWAQISGAAKFPRRFFITPNSNKAGLIVDLSRSIHPENLSFSYEWDNIPGLVPHPQGFYEVKVELAGSNKKHQILLNHDSYLVSDKNNSASKKINIRIPPHTKKIEISFNNLESGTGIWIYEFNLKMADSVLK